MTTLRRYMTTTVMVMGMTSEAIKTTAIQKCQTTASMARY